MNKSFRNRFNCINSSWIVAAIINQETQAYPLRLDSQFNLVYNYKSFKILFSFCRKKTSYQVKDFNTSQRLASLKILCKILAQEVLSSPIAPYCKLPGASPIPTSPTSEAILPFLTWGCYFGNWPPSWRLHTHTQTQTDRAVVGTALNCRDTLKDIFCQWQDTIHRCSSGCSRGGGEEVIDRWPALTGQ